VIREVNKGRSPWRWALLGALLVLLAYLPTLRNGAVWDDRHLVVDNPYFRDLAGIVDLFRNDIWTTTALGVRSEYYRPLPMLSFAVDDAIGGGSIAVFHFGNALLHALASFVLALVLHRALGGRSWILPVLCAVGWGLLPAHGEPVAWISGRFDVLATLLALIAFLANFGDSWKHRVVTVLATFASLLCKEAAILGPVALAMCDVILLRRPLRGLVPKYLALAAIVGVNIALRRWVGVITADAGTEPLELLRSLAFMVMGVLRRNLWPTGLDAFHPYVAPSLGLTAAVFVALALVALPLAWGSLRAERPANFRLAFFGLAWFCLTLAPAALTGPALDMVGDRYAYLPNIGLVFLAAGLLKEVDERLQGTSRKRALVLAGTFTGLLFVAWTWVGYLRLQDWRDDRSLTLASLRAHPGNPYALYALGEQAVLAGNHAEGDELLRQAIATGPRPWRALNALCYSLLRQRRYDEGAPFCIDSLAINGRDPRAWVNLATIRARQKRWDEALEYARSSLRYRKRYAEAHYLIAVALANLNQMPEALRELGEALRLDPEHKGARSFTKDLEKRGVIRAAQPPKPDDR